MINDLQITFLGTGTSQGIPIIGSTHPVCLSDDPRDTRLRVSVLISWDDYCYVIDCGPDFRQQMLTHKVSRIDGVLFTHEHADHTMGLDDIRPFFFRQGDIPIYAHKRVIGALKKRFDYIFVSENKYPGAPNVIENEIVNQPFFAYLTDVKTVEQEEREKLKGLDVLVVNALRIEPHHSHFNLQEALDFIKDINPKKAYLTHISHMLGFHAEVEKILPQNVFIAYDNLKIRL